MIRSLSSRQSSVSGFAVHSGQSGEKSMAEAAGSAGEEQFVQGGARIRRAHEGFPDQEGLDAVLAHAVDVFRQQDAAFGDDALAFREVLQHRQRGFEAGFEGPQIAVVDADQGRVQRQGRVQFVPVVDFNQHVHAQFRGHAFEFAQLGGRQGGGDQQHAVRTQRPGVDDLVGIDQEILAQHGQAAGGARLAQVIIAALEILHVGEHGQAGRAVAGVTGGDVRRPEILADHAFGGRCLLDFGDHGGLALGDPVFDGAHEAADVLAALGFAQHFGFAAHLPRGGDFGTLGVQNPGQNVVHAENLCVYWRNCSSLSRAAPEAISSKAWRMPASIESARLPAYRARPAFRATMSRAAPAVLFRAARTNWADSSRLATLMLRLDTMDMPKSSGWISYSRTSPSFSSPTRVAAPSEASSMPSLPCTTSTWREPRRCSTRTRMPTRSGWNTPMSWLAAPAGLVSGPRMLKIVRTPSSRRTAATFFMAPWWAGANMKPMPVASMDSATWAGVAVT